MKWLVGKTHSRQNGSGTNQEYIKLKQSTINNFDVFKLKKPDDFGLSYYLTTIELQNGRKCIGHAYVQLGINGRHIKNTRQLNVLAVVDLVCFTLT